MSWRINLKHALRQTLREKRRALPPGLQAKAATLITETLIKLPIYQTSQHLALYLSDEGEPDTQHIIKNALASGKNIYLPVLNETPDKSLSFFSYHVNDLLIKNRYGMMEPDPATQKEISAEDLDCVIVPLVAFDEAGHRMGRGAGYYDRSFSFIHEKPKKRPELIGLAYEFQKINELPNEKWDVNLDYIITEERLYEIIPSSK